MLSFSIVESESNINLITWTYPAVGADIQKVLQEKCFNLIKTTGFLWLRHRNTWVYIKQELGFAICLLATKYDVSRYKRLCNELAESYVKDANKVALVEIYLKNFIENAPNSTIKSPDLKALIRQFDLEVILIYTAILLKRRVLVYHYDVEQLLNVLQSISGLIPQRNPNDFLQPLVENTRTQLKALPFFVAGTIQEKDLIDDKIYDLLVHLPDQAIRISTHSTDIFLMTKVQKEIAVSLVNLSELEEDNNEQIVQEIKLKTDDLLNQLKSLKSDNGLITTSDLKSKQLNPKLEKFLFNLAMAEGVMMV